VPSFSLIPKKNIFFTQFSQHAQKIAIPIDGRPGSERNKRRLKRQPTSARDVDGFEKIPPRVILFELLEHRIIHRFHRTGDEQTSRVAQPR